MRTTFYTLAAIAGTVIASDNAANFDRDTAPEAYSTSAAVVTQISDGRQFSNRDAIAMRSLIS
jgi:hypothetical protein